MKEIKFTNGGIVFLPGFPKARNFEEAFLEKTTMLLLEMQRECIHQPFRGVGIRVDCNPANARFQDDYLD